MKLREVIKEIHKVDYCKNCGLPTDYCEYAQCIKKRIEERNEVSKTNELDSQLNSSLKIDEAQISQEIAQKKHEELNSTKKKKTKQNIITIKVESRARRKNVTVVNGLELFDIHLNEAAKKFAKQFSCGASVVKGTGGKPDHIDVQGDFDVTIAEFILKIYPNVEASNIVIQT
ncbi:translation initiation factor SUI1 family [Cryptosporidium sp. chipmunk genotype I]|uniref:translation initiation factor SUI1 family n=1 Tax=Cryptosporidium sp. chipmunk genotype I TaxID=1280935 RepID=UPI00351A451C|nr:translation initiation factor SUI1 family [Cryptosporidium sp. chipmunk genotype I]